MRFHFQFESLLDIRRHRENKERQKLGQLLEKQVSLEEKITQLKQKIAKFEETMLSGGSHKALAVRQQYTQKQELQKKSWQIQREQEKLEKKIAQQRHRLREANKQTRMLEKLKDRQRAEFVEEFQRQEQKQQNEVAIQMYNRSQ
jgi:flagellar FliJ protein